MHTNAKMFDREFGLPIHQPDPSAPPPTTGKARLEFQSAVNQCCCGSYILAEVGEHIGNVAKNVGVIASDPKRPTSKFKAGRAVRLLVVGPPGEVEVQVANRRQTEGWPVKRIALDRLPEMAENLDNLLMVPA